MIRTSVSFPYELRLSSTLGRIQRPVAKVEFYSIVFRRWIAYTLVVDTGADYCVLPASTAFDLGVELHKGERQMASGVGGQQRLLLHRKIRLRLGPWELTAPVGFVEQEDLPPLLGRYRCLDRFDLRLRQFVTTFSPPAPSS